MKLQKPLLITTALLSSSLLLSGCLPFGKQKPADTTDLSNQQPASTIADPTAMMAAIQSGTPLKCSLATAETGNQFEYYIQGSQFKMSASTLVEGKPETTHAINDGQYLYSWSESQSTGIKMKMPTEEELKTQAEKYKEYSQNAPDLTKADVVKEYQDKGYQVSCAPTTIPAGTFTPPTTVQFQDMSAMMENATKMMESSTMMEAGSQMTPEQQAQFETMMKQYQQ